MINSNRKTLFFVFGFILLCFYSAVKFESPRIIEQLYHANSLETLNYFAGTTESQNLDYYLGAIEENWIGPVSSATLGAFFILFALVFLQQSSTMLFGFAVLIFLILSKFEVLFFPPWGDHVGGSLSEAIWLKRNNFDYVGLLHQTGSIWGGPKYFLFSLYPGFMALLMKLSPSAQFFIFIAHLITFGMTSIIIALFRKIWLKFSDQTTAILASSFLLGLPLIQTMTEMINMDMTVTFFGFLCAYFLIEKRLGLSTTMAILAVLTKGSGAVFCGALFLINLLLFFFDDKNRFKPKLILYGLCALGIGLLQVYLRSNFVHTIDAKHNTVKFLCGLPTFQGHQFLTYFLFFSLIGFVLLIIQHFFQKQKKNFFASHYTFIVMLVISISWFLVQLNVSVCGPRYKLTLAPFLLFSVVFAYRSIFRSALLTKFSLVIATLVSFYSVYGALYQERVESAFYAYGPLERSLEYRNDLKLHMKLAKELETNFKDFTVGAPHVTAQMLAFEEYGYVQKPLNVLMYGMKITFGGIKNYEGLSKVDLNKTIWVGYKSKVNRGFSYPIDSKDKIVKEVNAGDKKVTLFMGGFAIEKMYFIAQKLQHLNSK